MKRFAGRVVSEVLWFLGDWVSRPMSHWDWAGLYPVYNWLMDASYKTQIWAGNDAPWQSNTIEKENE